MSGRADTRITPETPEPETAAIDIPEELSLKAMKKDFPLPELCSVLPETPGETVSKESQAMELPALPEVVPDDPEGVERALPELMDDILGRLSMLEVVQLRPKLSTKALKNPAFCQSHPTLEGEFSMTDDEGALHWHGFDTKLRKWTRLPSLSFVKAILPSPNPDLFKDYLVAGDGGRLCVNVGKATGREMLVICNPQTQQAKALPPLNYPRHPVLLHLKVDPDSGDYKVIVAGSAASGTDELSLKTEEYDSRTGVWICPDGSDLPCPPFGLTEYQNGVYVKDSERELLMCVAIVDTRGRGVLVYDMTKKKWALSPHVKEHCISVGRSATAQIVECGGSVFVFSEQECGGDVYCLIHKLLPEGTWEEVMKRKRTGESQAFEPSLLPELIDGIIGRLESMQEVVKLRSELGKAFMNAIHRPAFRRNRPQAEGAFSPSFFTTDAKGDLHWHGYDTLSRKWTRLPSLNFAKSILPFPDPDLFKDYLIAGDGGLLCINIKGREKLVICNPLTQQVKVLPPLHYPRHPVLMHLKVDHDSGHYKVIVAGSAASGTDKLLSLKTEEYDSRTGVWECPDGSDLPCAAFGLNEYQNGVCFKELLMCIAVIGTQGRGVLVYDTTKKKWTLSPHPYVPLVQGEDNVRAQLATTQIIQCGGSVFVFSEQECSRDEVYFVIHKLSPTGSGDFAWHELMRRKRTGERGSLTHSEITCVPVSEHELGYFNNVELTMELKDLSNRTYVEPIIAAPESKGNRFHSLNPIGFVFQPSFKSDVCPGRSRDPEVRCDPEREEYCSECRRAGSGSLRSGSDMNAGSKVISASSEETDAATNPVESFESEEDFFEKSLQLLAEISDFLDQF